MKKTVLLSMSLVTLATLPVLAAENQATTPPRTAQPAPPVMPAMGTGEAMEASPQTAEPISGTVLETIHNNGYCYVHLQQKNGAQVWVAIMEMPIKVGSSMSFKPGIVMTNFESKGLKRTFGAVVFSDGPVTAPDLRKVPEAPSKGTTAAPDAKISVAKATGPNAITVAEAFMNGGKLDRKRIVVSGKVVKVSPRIMKRNWIHIQDGTGSRDKGTDTLVCTSQGLVAVGNVVIVSGTLAKDRDFGSGYHYKAIIENATFTK